MRSKQFKKGFTLIELMIVVVVIALFSLVALPAYQSYARKALESQVQQQMLNLATRLERHKTRNFNYKNFETSQVILPAGATGSNVKYTIEIRDLVKSEEPDPDTGVVTEKKEFLLLSDPDAAGHIWVMTAKTTNEHNYNYFMSSLGVKCKNKSGNLVDFEGCNPEGMEDW